MTTMPTPVDSPSSHPEKYAEDHFFENVPPGQTKLVTPGSFKFATPTSVWATWEPMDLCLHCASEECAGDRYFRRTGTHNIYRAGRTFVFPEYVCRNCGKSVKRYAIEATYKAAGDLEMYKYGEVPQFGPPTPNKVLALMGSERENFLKGRRCENQGLGIAAFAYYRRVVEAQKGKIIDEICKVAEKLGSFPELVAELKAARAETRFSEALKMVKHGLPPILLIDGHNPLSLLHGALSEGLHATSDGECLTLATSIRVVLAELVERMDTAIKDDAGLKSAVQRLLDAAGKQK